MGIRWKKGRWEDFRITPKISVRATRTVPFPLLTMGRQGACWGHRQESTAPTVGQGSQANSSGRGPCWGGHGRHNQSPWNQISISGKTLQCVKILQCKCQELLFLLSWSHALFLKSQSGLCRENNACCDLFPRKDLDRSKSLQESQLGQQCPTGFCKNGSFIRDNAFILMLMKKESNMYLNADVKALKWMIKVNSRIPMLRKRIVNIFSPPHFLWSWGLNAGSCTLSACSTTKL